MPSTSLKTILTILCLAAGAGAFAHSPARAGGLAFSAPERLATLPWSGDSRPGVSGKGAEWLVVDRQGRYWLETDEDFSLFTRQGRYLQTASPLDKRDDYYGFTGMEALPNNGGIVLLQRLETLVEQQKKMNYEIESQPGARLIVLKPDGTVETKKDEVDPLQPHSGYFLEKGAVYSVHTDGTYQLLDSIGPPAKDGAFGNFARVADVVDWNRHARTLPVFRSASRLYHDALGNPREDKNSKFFLMDRPFVEGAAPLAERDGKIYDQVVCYPKGDFTNSVFVEDSVRKNYALVDLVPPDGDLEPAYDHALFVDAKGDLYEGVAKKDGYRIYEWRILN